MDRFDVDDLVSDFSRFYMLTILYEGPTHGYGIIRKFQRRVGKKISPGLVYPFLQRHYSLPRQGGFLSLTSSAGTGCFFRSVLERLALFPLY